MAMVLPKTQVSDPEPSWPSCVYIQQIPSFVKHYSVNSLNIDGSKTLLCGQGK